MPKAYNSASSHLASARRQLCLGARNFSHETQGFGLERVNLLPQRGGLGFEVLIRSLLLTKREDPSRFLKEMGRPFLLPPRCVPCYLIYVTVYALASC